MNENVTRRRAMATGGQAALAAGLLGSTTKVDAIAEEVRGCIEACNAAYEVADVAEAALRAALSPEQDLLFCRYQRAREDREYLTERMYVAELGRHLPGLAPALWAIFAHMTDGASTGECCVPTGGPARVGARR